MASSGFVKQRIDDVGRALQHHRAGACDASVLIVLSLIDGLARDVFNVSIFSKSRKSADLLTGVLLSPAAIHSLETIRAILAMDVSTTRVKGELSRHGALHGSERGYDTKPNSTKACVALIAVLEWLQAVAPDRSR